MYVETQLNSSPGGLWVSDFEVAASALGSTQQSAREHRKPQKATEQISPKAKLRTKLMGGVKTSGLAFKSTPRASEFKNHILMKTRSALARRCDW